VGLTPLFFYLFWFYGLIVLSLHKFYNMNDFNKFATKHMGISSIYLNDFQNSMTPHILEERPTRANLMSVFDRLMQDRIIWVAGPVDEGMSQVIQAQLIYLSNSDSKKEITMHLDTPGGSVKAGLSIVDVMDYISNDIRTINTGMAASMGSVLLGAGTKGKRMSLRFSQTMLHQSSGGLQGNIQDARITMKEWEKVNDILFNLLGGYCGKDAEQVKQDAARDLWLSSDEALAYGIIDEIVKPKK
jgi:ATP-dependent Clp protease, protease subunit